MSNHRTGLWAEFYALVYLLLRGYWPLRRRWRTPVGEIDILCRTYRHLIIVEVKRRQDGMGADAPVSAAQQARLNRAMAYAQQIRAQWQKLQPRFDVIVIAPNRWPQHIRNAF